MSTITDREIELLELVASGAPAEQKLAQEELDAIDRRRSKAAPIEPRGDLIDTYTVGDWTADIYLAKSRGQSEETLNPARKLRIQRGDGIISQPTFYEKHLRAHDGYATIEKRYCVRYVMVILSHKNGTQSSRKVISRGDKLIYRDDRFDKAVRRNDFLASFPQALAQYSEDITVAMEFFAPPK